MRARRRMVAVIAGAACAVGLVVAFAPSGYAAISAVAVACSAPAWAEGNSYTAGQQVTYQGHLYTALVTHTAWPGAGWNPASTPSLWTDNGGGRGGTPTPRGTPPPPPTPSPTTPPTTPPVTVPPGGGSFKAPVYFMPIENSPQDVGTA